MAMRKTNGKQTTIPGTDGDGKKQPSLAKVVERVFEIDRQLEQQAEAAAQKARDKYRAKAAEKRAEWLAKLPEDQRGIADAMITSGLRAQAEEAKRRAAAVAPEQVELPTA